MNKKNLFSLLFFLLSCTTAPLYAQDPLNPTITMTQDYRAYMCSQLQRYFPHFASKVSLVKCFPGKELNVIDFAKTLKIILFMYYKVPSAEYDKKCTRAYNLILQMLFDERYPQALKILKSCDLYNPPIPTNYAPQSINRKARPAALSEISEKPPLQYLPEPVWSMPPRAY